jgi:hypothetical protein
MCANLRNRELPGKAGQADMARCAGKISGKANENPIPTCHVVTGARSRRDNYSVLPGVGFRLRLVCRCLQFGRRLCGFLGCSFLLIGRFIRKGGLQLVCFRVRFRGCGCDGFSSGFEIGLVPLARSLCVVRKFIFGRDVEKRSVAK